MPVLTRSSFGAGAGTFTSVAVLSSVVPVPVQVPVPVPIPALPSNTAPAQEEAVTPVNSSWPQFLKEWAMLYDIATSSLTRLQRCSAALSQDPSTNINDETGPGFEHLLKVIKYLEDSAHSRNKLEYQTWAVAKRNLVRQLRDILNRMKMTLIESEGNAAQKLRNSTLVIFMQKVDETNVLCTWPIATRDSAPVTALATATASATALATAPATAPATALATAPASANVTAHALAISPRMLLIKQYQSGQIKRKLVGDSGSFTKLFPAPKKFRDVFTSAPENNSMAPSKNKENEATSSIIISKSARTGPGTVTVTKTGGAFNIITMIQMRKFSMLKELLWTLNLAGSSIYDFLPILKNNMEIHSKLTVFGINVTGDPKIKGNTLEMGVLTAVLSQIIMKILQSSQKTLRTFQIMTPLSVFPGLTLPALPNVEELKLATRKQITPTTTTTTTESATNVTKVPPKINQRPYFPSGINLAETFPNLIKVSIEFGNMDVKESWENYFGQEINTIRGAPLITVKSLEITKNCKWLPLGWMSKFSRIFPNAESISIDTFFHNFPNTMEGLWMFSKLKSLKLKIPLVDHGNFQYFIDLAFTGFSKETCMRLLEASAAAGAGGPLPGPVPIWAERVRPSILDLKELTRLQVTFVNINPNPNTGIFQKTVTNLSGLYAFNMCPKLLVCLEAVGRTTEESKRLMKALSPWHPFVHIHVPQF